MSKIIQFDADYLRDLVLQYGLHDTWRMIMATHIKKLRKFDYILKSEEYKDSETLAIDILEGMSIGEIGVLYEFSHAVHDADNRQEKGVYYTPDDIAKFMAEQSVDFSEGIWLDPCSGVGNLSWHLAAVQNDPESFVLNYLRLSDVDSTALLIARTILTCSFQNKNKNLFNDLRHNFTVVDFLDGSAADKIPKHDYVIVNPPYLGLKKAINDFETSTAKDLYAYFIEVITRTSTGFISITPQSFTNADKFTPLRKLLLDNYSSLNILCFDNIPGNIFKGIKFGSKNSNTANSVRAAIMIAKNDIEERRITPLLRWRSDERDLLINYAKQALGAAQLEAELFPKVGKGYENLYMAVKDLPRLKEIVSKRRTEYYLNIPSTPRYYISGVKSDIKRSSMKRLYFTNIEDLNRAYLLINSSFMYWWWRVVDGGMTLSLATLESLPLIQFDISNKLVQMLEESERVNRVYKMNGGAAQENIKHDESLVIALDEYVIAAYVEVLELVSNNSIYPYLHHINTLDDFVKRVDASEKATYLFAPDAH